MNRWINRIFTTYQLYQCHRWSLISICNGEKTIKPDLTLSGGSKTRRKYCLGEKRERVSGKREVLSVRSSDNGFCSLVAELTEQVQYFQEIWKKKNILLTRHNKLSENDRVCLVMWHALCGMPETSQCAKLHRKLMRSGLLFFTA